MTEYVYELRTNTPVGAFTGAGGVPDVHHSTGWGNTNIIGAHSHSQSVASSASDGHRFDLTLVEIVPDAGALVDDLVRLAEIELTPWQRAVMVQWVERNPRP